MTKHLTKRDFEGKILGIEWYTPGEEGTQDLSISISSGTTGKGISMALFRLFERSPLSEQFRMFRHDNVRAFLRLITKNSQAIRTSHIQLGLPKPRRVLCLDEHDLSFPQLSRLLQEFEPDYLFGTTTRIEKLLRSLEGEGKTESLHTLAFIRPTSESVLKRHVDLTARLYPRATVISDYGLAETENVAVGCPELNKKYPLQAFKVFHPFSSVCTVEILDPNAEGYGEIVVSTTVTGVENYRTGDVGRMVEEKCTCGASGTLFVVGRKDFDIAYCAGATFLLDEIDRVFTGFADEVEDYQLIVKEIADRVSLRGDVLFRIVLKRGARQSNPQDFLSRIARSLAVTKTRTLADLVSEGIFEQPRIEYVETLSEGGAKRIRLVKRVD
jgi:phenylacetate-coenzyme A ligase PaaK-like adenylate-forming protein